MGLTSNLGKEYELDGEGNRGAVTAITPGTSVRTPYTKNAMNEYTSVGLGENTEKLVFDDNGNLIKDGRFEYRYDYANRLVETVNPDPNKDAGELDKVVYDFDVLGRRIAKKVFKISSELVSTLNDEASTRYWSDGTEELEETDVTGATLRKRYTYGTVIDEVCRMDLFGVGPTPERSYYYHGNHQGTIYTVTDGELSHFLTPSLNMAHASTIPSKP